MKKVILFILRCVQFAFSLIADLFYALVDAFSKQNGFNAEFGSERLIANRFNKGFVIARHRKLSRRKSFQNLIISGPTGSGKTVKLIIKSLFTLKNCSILLTDPSKELYYITSGYLSKYFNIRTLNFGDSSVSSGYNVLSRVKKPNDINKIVHMLVSATLDKGGGGDKFWSLSVKSCLQILFRLTLHQQEQYRNLGNVLHLLHTFSSNPEKIDVLIAGTNDDRLIAEYKSFISTPEKTLASILASAKAAMQLFDDPQVAKTTAHDTIDFDELREKPTIIFLHNSIGEQRYISLLNSLFFEQFYNHVLQRLPHKNELEVFVILEECASMYIDILPLALANCRKHFVANMLCVQSHTQLKSNYRDEADNITANCVTKLFLPGETSMEVLREVEALSGKCIYKDDEGKERTKSLVTVDEIRQLPDNRSLIISGNHPIIKGRVSPYWRNLNFRRYAKIPPVPFRGEIPDSPIQLIKV